MRDTLSNMMSCFLMSRQQAHMKNRNSQFLHIYIYAKSAQFLAPAVTVGETEGARDSTSVLFFTSSFAYNFARK